MNRADPRDVAADDLGAASERHRLSRELATTDLALHRYRLAPGDGLPGGLHAHADQEEVFVVLAGTATFETPEAPGDRVTVSAGEAVRFAPGEFQSGWNRGDADCVVLALGAPRESEDTRVPIPCPDCGHGDLRLALDGADPTLDCPDCGAAHVPEPCPDCGDGELLVRLDDEGGTQVVCEDCASTFAGAPLG
ncbi:cupin domain-containing protein [Haloarchaeobius amylolyticus]|uniref:cupin domain-containing protein n=1 Tax=Haloarchaeobius amylolyticus TaxID=1198296 RepID=UPI0022721C0E|nr:cupin domain-containing protein [Haloarchaeobius amylolyticus]